MNKKKGKKKYNKEKKEPTARKTEDSNLKERDDWFLKGMERSHI